MSIHDYNKGFQKGRNNIGLPKNVSELAGHMAGKQSNQPFLASSNSSPATNSELPEWMQVLVRFTGPIGGLIGLGLGYWFYGLSWLILAFCVGGAFIGVVTPFLLFGAFYLLLGLITLAIIGAIIFGIAKLIFQF